MYDQANELRQLVRTRARAHQGLAQDRTPRLIALAGGKGGVGASTIAVSLALALAAEGQRTLLIDADFERPDIADLLGLGDGPTINDVLRGGLTLHEALRRGPAGVQVLAGAWAPETALEVSPASAARIVEQLQGLGAHADFMVVDLGSRGRRVAHVFWSAAEEVLLATSTDTASIMNAYAAVKLLPLGAQTPPIRTVVNRATDDVLAVEAHERIGRACHRFLGRVVTAAATLPEHASPLVAGRFADSDLFGRTLRSLAEELISRPTSPRPTAAPQAALA